MAETSIAEAKNHLTRLIHQVERGDAVHITRRGRPVAVLLSEAEFARLSRGTTRPTFWEAIQAMRADPDFEPLDLEPEEIASWRDRAAEGRDFEWPE
jgi:prevent-host-death family protein